MNDYYYSKKIEASIFRFYKIIILCSIFKKKLKIHMRIR